MPKQRVTFEWGCPKCRELNTTSGSVDLPASFDPLNEDHRRERNQASKRLFQEAKANCKKCGAVISLSDTVYVTFYDISEG
jgi:predicted nucleic-acid-binding Zn-ribbon protein